VEIAELYASSNVAIRHKQSTSHFVGPFYLSRLLDCFTLQVQRKGFCDIFPGKNIIFPLSCAAAFLDFDSVMTPEELFTLALGLGDQWHVSRCVFEGEPKRLELELKHVCGKQFECPQCGSLCSVHDTVERRWRHMNFFQYRCDLVAKVPRTWCRTDGVHQIKVPWAREGSGFTLLMEGLILLLSAQMPVDAMADLLDEHDTRLWRILIHYVEQAHALSAWSSVVRIAVDETSARRGHRYGTNILDAQNSTLLLMVEGRASEALGAFAKALVEHSGDPSQIEAIAMDMSPAYVKGAGQYFPRARIVFDKFHLMVLAGQALDEVRRDLQRQGAQLKGSMWSLRGNMSNLSPERQEQRKNLCREYTKLGRAMSLREALQAFYTCLDRQSAEADLAWWCAWALRSRLNPFQNLAKTIRQHWEGVLAYFETGLTSAAIEAINGVIQLAKRMARGFRNFVYFRTVAYQRAGKLNMAIPAII
jgi:transposase